MRRQPYCARMLTTHQLTGGEETEWWNQSADMGIVRRPWWSEANWWIWPGYWGHTSTLFERHRWIFNNQSQDLGLTSHPKDGAFYSIESPSLYWGVMTHTDHRVSTPCWPRQHLFQQQPSFLRSPIQDIKRPEMLRKENHNSTTRIKYAREKPVKNCYCKSLLQIMRTANYFFIKGKWPDTLW